jgi:RNA polymerase sigma-70 factor, ECF subfamily
MIIEESNQLFEQIQNDNENAFELLYKRLFPRLKDFANRIVRDEDIAKDIVQDVFIKLWEKKKEIKLINIEAFIFKVLRNQCISHIKNLKIVENVKINLSDLQYAEELYRIDFIKNEPYLLVEKELQLEVEKVMKSLPDQCKNVFHLSRIEGLKNREIAERLGINIKNVERHITRALTSFKDHFGDKIPIAVIILIIQSLNQ